MLSRLHTITECDRRADRQTDKIAISILRVSIAVLTRDKTLCCTQWCNQKKNITFESGAIASRTITVETFGITSNISSRSFKVKQITKKERCVCMLVT